MENLTNLTLINQQNGDVAFKILMFEDADHFKSLQRNNHYSLIWITEGGGRATVDFATYEIKEKSIFAFSPDQPFLFSSANIKGIAIYFHPDFFCIQRHQTETTCLFNDIHQLPYTIIDNVSQELLFVLIDQMKSELKNPGVDQGEILISYLKIFLINIARIKMKQKIGERFGSFSAKGAAHPSNLEGHH